MRAATYRCFDSQAIQPRIAIQKRGVIMGRIQSGSATRGRVSRSAQAIVESLLRQPLRVLVVDDSPVNQMIAVAQLEHLDVTPVLASDGTEAVALACGATFDLILMDLQMPVLDGLGATAQIRRFERDHAWPRVPVVAYTSCAVGSDSAFVRSFGLDAVLEKPSSLTQLEECLLTWCPAHAANLRGSQPAQAPRRLRVASAR